jgi:hypothetical protein
MSEFYSNYACDFDSFYSIVVEDDGRVAYAYLVENEEDITGHVWLYNQLATPTNTVWIESEMPFLNPIEYIGSNQNTKPLTESSEIVVRWELSQNNIIIANLYIRDTLIAKLSPQDFPGWSTMVIKDGPLAKKWII